MGQRYGEGLSVLVVDDESAICQLLEAVLDEAGFDITLTASLAQAREAAKRGFDLAIIDKNLPDGVGLDAIPDVRAARADAGIIIMTAYPTIESANQTLDVGLTDYVVKPFDIDWIENRIQRVLRELITQRELHEAIKELQSKNEILEQMVVRDGLTQLHNHRFLQESLESEIARARRSGATLSLLLIDIDDFKHVNDQLGHPSGDALLKTIAQILRGEIRSSDGAFRLRDKDIAGRYGGDEFALILPDTPRGGAALKAERLREFVANYDFETQELQNVTLSVGVANYPQDAADRGSLIEAADVALYAAKRVGKNRIMSYGPSLVRAGVERAKAVQEAVDLYLALEHAITDEAFDFAYQPIVNVESGKITAYESLCRPVDRQHFPSPQLLFETAHRAGRIQDLGNVVRKLAPRPMDRLPEPMKLTINLHPLELNDELLSWADQVQDISHRLILEITETAAIHNYGYVGELIQKLRTRGFRIALDDLGAGYMGLNALARLAPDYVKLDMTLLRGIEAESSSAHLIRHLLTYAQDEGIQVIAEGIETTEERDVVIALGCEMMQGYLFGRPAKTFTGLNPETRAS